MIFIHAGNHAQARSAANWLELHKDGWRYLDTGDEMRGYATTPKVLCFGTYLDHPRRDYILAMMFHLSAFVSRLEDR